MVVWRVPGGHNDRQRAHHGRHAALGTLVRSLRPETDSRWSNIVTRILKETLISTTNLAACVCPQNLTNFCPYAFISSPNVPKILFA